MEANLGYNIVFFKKLHNTSTDELRSYLKAANWQEIHCLCECVLNVINGNVKISVESTYSLYPKRKQWQKLFDPKVALSIRKRILIHNASLLPLILGPIYEQLIDEEKTKQEDEDRSPESEFYSPGDEE